MENGAAMETRRRNVMFSGRSIVGLVVLFLVSGCASLSARNPTRPLVASSDMSKDQNDCERYAKGQAKDKGEEYRACMISRSYAANVEMDDLDWTLGIAQTRPHEPPQVMKDLEECDERADDTKKKKSDAPPLTPEQERIIASQGVNLQRRPDAARVLVHCLDERGYQVVPRVAY
jgi:hypothetical protein